MQLSWLRSTALVLLLAACGDDSEEDDVDTKDDAAVSGTDGAKDSGASSGADTGVVNPRDSGAADTGTKPPAVDGGPGPVTDAGPTDGGGSTSPDAGASDAGTTPDAGGATGESFAALYESILKPTCATASCHGMATHTSGLRMDTVGAAHSALLKTVGADQNGSPGSPCASMTTNPRVSPGDPSKSWLLVMIAPNPPCGMQMPPPMMATKLTTAQQKRISDWIAQGAKNN